MKMRRGGRQRRQVIQVKCLTDESLEEALKGPKSHQVGLQVI